MLREEHRIAGFENRVLRKIFRTKREVVRGDRRKLHNSCYVFLTKYYLYDHITVNEAGGAYGIWGIGEMCTVLVGEALRKETN